MGSLFYPGCLASESQRWDTGQTFSCLRDTLPQDLPAFTFLFYSTFISYNPPFMLYFTLQIRTLVSANCLEKLFPEKGSPCCEQGKQILALYARGCVAGIFMDILYQTIWLALFISVLVIIGLRWAVIKIYYSLPIIIAWLILIWSSLHCCLERLLKGLVVIV